MICIPVIEPTTEAATLAMKEASTHGDVIELRLDAMRSPDLPALLAGRPGNPIIATLRSVDEGGGYSGEPEAKVELLAKAAELGADYVDIELRTGTEAVKELVARKGNAKVIASWHGFVDTPDRTTLRRHLREAFEAGADVCKIVPFARKAEDNGRVLEVVADASRRGKLVIGFCMGDLGRFSRVATLFMGGLLTYAYMREGRQVAPGMMSVTELKKYLADFGWPIWAPGGVDWELGTPAAR
jgi:3-dehydroquinate dehydratase type I